MIVKNFFEKDINRNIETVIKADDRDHISTEVAEYVITKDIAKKIGELFYSYNNYTGANGVWISGFFGSGKSHLLKIISYVLENKEVDGLKCGEIFAQKIEGDDMLKGDVLKAAQTPSESILFNIDQQSQITSKTDANAILSVFYKVFYDHLGYYGFQPHVAEFEMWLDKQGKYQDFKTQFEALHNSSWLSARNDYFDPLVTDDMAQVLGQIFNAQAHKYENILDTIEDKQKQSIEEFCQKVDEYIKSKPKNFRLNFFVDEVGQYISDNTKLMLNLQTIAETLATITKGHAWILVTSQEDMEKVVGDMSKNQENDFSRIQARFKIKVPLTSQNIDEVIEKRLLKKTPEAQNLLSNIFKKEHALMDTLLSFSDAGLQFKGYKNAQDFGNKMPFVAYQFDLFQQCRIALSNHNAFQGKHASVGERSMLGVFQYVIQKIEEGEPNALVSFDLMFEGIRNELKGQIQQGILFAENNLDNPFAIKVLKTLFLVKYFGHFKTTKRNIAVLMIDNIGIDLKKHEQKIDEALNVLEHQSYVQRNGEIYEFLTDDEKDIEKEIKNTEIDDQAVSVLLKEILFDEIIVDQKIKYHDNKQDYEFTSKIDGSVLGREKELEIEIITENSPNFSNISFIQSQTIGSAGLKFLLPSNATFMKDLKMYIKTDKYNKQNQSTSNKEQVKRILQEKMRQNADRRKNLKIMANKALAEAQVFLNGDKMQIPQTADGKTLVINAFQNLVKTVYTNLRMLGNNQFSEDSFKQFINQQSDMFKDDNQSISEAEMELLTIINRRKAQSDRSSLQDLKTIFAKKPYGWYPNAVWTLVAKLYKRGKIEVKTDANVLGDADLIKALLNSANHANTILEAQSVIDPKLVIALKQTYADAFDEACPANDARDVANAFKEKLQAMNQELANLLLRQTELPFLASLTDFKNLVAQWCKKDYNYWLTQLTDFEDSLLDNKENLLDPIKRFINGDQLKIYQSIATMVKSDTSNFTYIEGTQFAVLKDLLEHPKPYQGHTIKEAKAAQDELRTKVLERIELERNQAIAAIQKNIEDIKSKEEFAKLQPEHQNKIIWPFENVINKLKTERYIGVIKDEKTKAAEHLFTQQLNQMMLLSRPEDSQADSVQEPRPHYIRKSSIKVNFDKTELRTEEDVNLYLEALKKAFLLQINETKRISL